MQTDKLAAFWQRIAGISARAVEDFAGFGNDRRVVVDYETRRAADRYSWRGAKRRRRAGQSMVLFQYTLAGRGEYEEGGRRWRLDAGRGFTVLLPSRHHYYLPDDSESWTFFWIMIEHPFVAQRMRRLRRTEAAVQEWPPDFPALTAAANLFEAICAGRMQDPWQFEELLFTWLWETERELQQRRYPRDERQRLLEQTRAVVLRRLESPPGTAELAEMHRLERTTFSRKFKAATGQTPGDFMTGIRLEEAVKLLRTQANLKEVAARTGFADANHFCKVFRRHFHISPGSYRRLGLRN